MGPKRKKNRGKQGKEPTPGGQNDAVRPEAPSETPPNPLVEPAQTPTPARPEPTPNAPVEPAQTQIPAENPGLQPPPPESKVGSDAASTKKRKKNRKCDNKVKRAARERDERLFGAEGSGAERTSDAETTDASAISSQAPSRAPSARSVASFESWRKKAVVAPGIPLVTPDGDLLTGQGNGPTSDPAEKDAFSWQLESATSQPTSQRARTTSPFGPPGGSLITPKPQARPRSASLTASAASSSKSQEQREVKEASDTGPTLLVKQPTPPESVRRTLSTASLPSSDTAISPSGEPTPIGHRPSIAVSNVPPPLPTQLPTSPEIFDKSLSRTKASPLPISLTSPGGTQKEPEVFNGKGVGMKNPKPEVGLAIKGVPEPESLSPATAKFIASSTKPLNISKENKPARKPSETAPSDEIPIPKPLKIVKQKNQLEASEAQSPPASSGAEPPTPSSSTSATTNRKPPPPPPIKSKKSGLAGSAWAPESPTKPLFEKFPTNTRPPLPDVKVTSRKQAPESTAPETSAKSPDTESFEKTPAPSIAGSAGSSSVKSKRQSAMDAFTKAMPSSKKEKEEFYSGGGSPKEKNRLFAECRKNLKNPANWGKSKDNKTTVSGSKAISGGGGFSDDIADDLIFTGTPKDFAALEPLVAYSAGTPSNANEAEMVTAASASTGARIPPSWIQPQGLNTEQLVPEDIVRSGDEEESNATAEQNEPPEPQQGSSSAVGAGAPPSSSSSSSDDEDDKGGDNQGEDKAFDDPVDEEDLEEDLPDHVKKTLTDPEEELIHLRGTRVAASSAPEPQAQPQGSEVEPNRLYEPAVRLSDPRYRGPEFANLGRRMFQAVRDPTLLQEGGRQFDLLAQYESPRGPFTQLGAGPRLASGRLASGVTTAAAVFPESTQPAQSSQPAQPAQLEQTPRGQRSLFDPVPPPNPSIRNVPAADTLTGITKEGDAIRFKPGRNFESQFSILFDPTPRGAVQQPALSSSQDPFTSSLGSGIQLPIFPHDSPPPSPPAGSGSISRTFDPFRPEDGKSFDTFNSMRGGQPFFAPPGPGGPYTTVATPGSRVASGSAAIGSPRFSTTPAGQPPDMSQSIPAGLSTTPLESPPGRLTRRTAVGLSTTPLESPPERLIRRKAAENTEEITPKDDEELSLPPGFNLFGAGRGSGLAPLDFASILQQNPFQDTPSRVPGQGRGISTSGGLRSLFLPGSQSRPVFGGPPQPDIDGRGKQPTPGNRPLGQFGIESPEELQKIEHAKARQGSGSGKFVKPPRAVMLPQAIRDFEELLRRNPTATWHPLANAAFDEMRGEIHSSVASQVALQAQVAQLLKVINKVGDMNVKGSKKSQEDAQTILALQGEVRGLESQAASAPPQLEGSEEEGEPDEMNQDDADTNMYDAPTSPNRSAAVQARITELADDLHDCQESVQTLTSQKQALENQVTQLQAAAPGSLPEDHATIAQLREDLRICRESEQQMISFHNTAPGHDVPLPHSHSAQSPRTTIDDKCQRRIDEIQRRLTDSEATEQRLQDERYEVQTLLGQCEQANTDMSAELDELNPQLAKLTAQLATANAEKDILRKCVGDDGDPGNLQAAFDDAIARIRTLNERLEGVRQEHKDDFNKAKAELKDQERQLNDKFAAEKSQIQQELERLWREGQQIPGQGGMIAKTQCDADKAVLKRANATLTAEKELLEAEQDTLKAANKDLLDQMSRISTGRTLADDLGSEDISEDEDEAVESEVAESPTDAASTSTPGPQLSRDDCNRELVNLEWRLKREHQEELEDYMSKNECDQKLVDIEELYGQLRAKLAQVMDVGVDDALRSKDTKKTATGENFRQWEDCEKDKERLVKVHEQSRRSLLKMIGDLEQQIKNLESADYESDFDPDANEPSDDQEDKTPAPRLMSRKNCEKKIKILRDQIAKGKEDFDKLTNRMALQDSSHQDTVQQLRDQVATLNTPLTNLQTTPAAGPSAVTEDDTNGNQVLQDEIKALKKEMADLEAEIERLKSEEKGQASTTKTETNFRDCETARIALQGEVKNLKERPKAKQQEIDAAHSKGPTPKAVLEGLQNEIDELMRQARGLRADNARLRGAQGSGSRPRGSDSPPGDANVDTVNTIIRTRLAMRRMAHRRGILGVNDVPANGHIATARNAIELAAVLADNIRNQDPSHRQEWLGRAQLWRGIVEFYGANYAEALRYFNEADLYRRLLDDVERNFLRGWIRLLREAPGGTVTTNLDDYWTGAELAAMKRRCKERHDECKERKRARKRERKLNRVSTVTTALSGRSKKKKARFDQAKAHP